MTKQQLIDGLAEKEGISKHTAKLIVDIIFQEMTDALARGDRIEIRGFASFSVKHYPKYVGRNPKTGKPVAVKPKKLPVFRAGKELSERVYCN